jgi:hypothetical protein
MNRLNDPPSTCEQCGGPLDGWKSPGCEELGHYLCVDCDQAATTEAERAMEMYFAVKDALSPEARSAVIGADQSQN